MNATLEFPELLRRARMSLAWTPKRRKSAARRLAAALADPGVRARQLAALKELNARTKPERIARLVAFNRRSEWVLPPMTRRERRRYRYLRTMTSRENALSVIMSEREAGGG